MFFFTFDYLRIPPLRKYLGHLGGVFLERGVLLTGIPLLSEPLRMFISQLHALQSLSVMFLVSEVPISEIWDLAWGGGVAPLQICCNLEYVENVDSGPRVTDCYGNIGFNC